VASVTAVPVDWRLLATLDKFCSRSALLVPKSPVGVPFDRKCEVVMQLLLSQLLKNSSCELPPPDI
jgi:hypothetical protein